MAIVFAVQKWRDYLIGQKFYNRIDQKSLKFLMEQHEANPEYKKWMIKLMGYQFEIQYQLQTKNKVVDALSRISSSTELMALSSPTVLQLNTLVEEVKANEYF